MSISPVIYLTSLEGLGIDGCSKEGEYFIGVCFCFVLFKEGHRNNNDFGTYHLLALSYLGRGKSHYLSSISSENTRTCAMSFGRITINSLRTW